MEQCKVLGLYRKFQNVHKYHDAGHKTVELTCKVVSKLD